MRNYFPGCDRVPEASDSRPDRSLHVIVCACLEGEECFDFSAELRIAITGIVEQSGALTWVAFCDTVEQLFNLCPTLRVQEHLPAQHFAMKPGLGHSQVTANSHCGHL